MILIQIYNGCSISAQATNALVKIEWRHYCWLYWYLWLYRLQHGNVWTFVVFICRLAWILFIWQLIVVRKLKAFQNNILELE